MEEEGLRLNAHDVQYMPGPPAEFRVVPMLCLSYRSGQQQHLLHIGVHGAEELLAAVRRVLD